MLQYFLHCKAVDGLPNNNHRNLNSPAFPLCHIQGLLYKRYSESIERSHLTFCYGTPTIRNYNLSTPYILPEIIYPRIPSNLDIVEYTFHLFI